MNVTPTHGDLAVIDPTTLVALILTLYCLAVAPEGPLSLYDELLLNMFVTLPAPVQVPCSPVVIGQFERLVQYSKS